MSVRLVLAAAVVFGLAACQSAEERAEEHFRSALALLEEGDLERATVEFRNVFELNGTHVEARRAYAEAVRDAGRTREAYSQFLRLVEQRPNDVEGRIALAQMATDLQNWEEVRRHGSRAVELAAEDPRLIPVMATMSYADALEAEDESARRAAADAASEALADDPGNMGLYRILIDDALRGGDQDLALERVAAALELAPDDRDLHNTRLALLAELEDGEGIERQLTEMIARFPEDESLTATLLRYHISRGDVEAAETFLRDRIAQTPAEDHDARVALVQLLLQRDGPEAALAELDAIISAAPETTVYRILRSGIRFETGAREDAISELQALIDAGEASQTQLNQARIALARMLSADENPVGARRLVGEVLENDPSDVEALKLEAGWLIDEDRADNAIALLRTAIDESPEDSEAMTLMARAHERNGNRELMRDFLSLAYEASGAAPGETLRYAGSLMADELYLPAEEVLIGALRIAPNTPELLDQLGQLYILMEDWARAEHAERTLRGIGTGEAARLADGLQVARLAAQGNMDDAIAFLEQLAEEGDGADLAAEVAVIRARLARGDRSGALAYLDELLEEDPENFTLRFVQATVWTGLGRYDEAEALYRALVEERPEVEQLWIGLVRALHAQGDVERAEAALAEGLAVLPEGLNLLWAQASFRERRGDFEGAIELYELMYERAPNQPVIANNLASLISTYRDDDDSLERAHVIARRLRGTDFAPFQDTYGWIAFRRGDLEEAGQYLESAAATLTDDALVQFHYGMFLAADGQIEAALDRLSRALEIAGPDDTRPQFDIARVEIERLEALTEENTQ